VVVPEVVIIIGIALVPIPAVDVVDVRAIIGALSPPLLALLAVILPVPAFIPMLVVPVTAVALVPPRITPYEPLFWRITIAPDTVPSILPAAADVALTVRA
jgi:hypothetical protein